MTKVPYGLGPLMTNSPESWHSQTKKVLLMTSRLGTPLNLTGHQMHSSKCTFWMVEIRENILIGHKAKFSGHRTRQKEEPHSVFTYGTHSKVCLNSCWSGENCQLTSL